MTGVVDPHSQFTKSLRSVEDLSSSVQDMYQKLSDGLLYMDSAPHPTVSRILLEQRTEIDSVVGQLDSILDNKRPTQTIDSMKTKLLSIKTTLSCLPAPVTCMPNAETGMWGHMDTHVSALEIDRKPAKSINLVRLNEGKSLQRLSPDVCNALKVLISNGLIATNTASKTAQGKKGYVHTKLNQDIHFIPNETHQNICSQFAHLKF